jgi:hypothetical protein
MREANAQRSRIADDAWEDLSDADLEAPAFVAGYDNVTVIGKMAK